MICSNCGKRISKGAIDIGHHWNLSEDLAFACSEKCAKEAPKNWLSDSPASILYKNKFKNKEE